MQALLEALSLLEEDKAVMQTPIKREPDLYDAKQSSDATSTEKKMLHSGALLGDLPAFSTPASNSKGQWSGQDDARLHAALENGGLLVDEGM